MITAMIRVGEKGIVRQGLGGFCFWRKNAVATVKEHHFIWDGKHGEWFYSFEGADELVPIANVDLFTDKKANES